MVNANRYVMSIMGSKLLRMRIAIFIILAPLIFLSGAMSFLNVYAFNEPKEVQAINLSPWLLNRIKNMEINDIAKIQLLDSFQNIKGTHLLDTIISKIDSLEKAGILTSAQVMRIKTEIQSALASRTITGEGTAANPIINAGYFVCSSNSQIVGNFSSSISFDASSFQGRTSGTWNIKKDNPTQENKGTIDHISNDPNLTGYVILEGTETDDQICPGNSIPADIQIHVPCSAPQPPNGGSSDIFFDSSNGEKGDFKPRSIHCS
ncbi:MAG TPA: hypothetical protein VJ729_02150 [Nitrososphaeraceae archaeon]|nr:hypothetical protein [Nitrososphaeraceae archaeon]